MKLSELRNMVVANTSRRDKVTLIDQALNLALIEMAQRAPYKRLNRVTYEVPVVEGDGSFTPPVDYVQIVSVQVVTPDVNTRGPLRIKTKSDLHGRFPNFLDSANSGTPAWGYIEAGRIWFYPKASQSFTMSITLDLLPAKLTDDEDQSPDSNWDNALVAWATAYTFRSLQQWQDAAGWDQQFEQAFRTMIRADRRSPSEGRSRQPDERNDYGDDYRVNRWTRT